MPAISKSSSTNGAPEKTQKNRLGDTVTTVAKSPSSEHQTKTWADLALEVSDIEYLIQDFVPNAMITGIIAPPKRGKSAYVLGGVVQPVIMGIPFFNGSPAVEPSNVLWVDTEANAGINIKRATEWGLPLERIKTPFQDDVFRPVNIADIDGGARGFEDSPSAYFG